MNEHTTSPLGKPTRNGWKYVFYFLGFLVVATAFVSLKYRALPKKSAIVTFPTLPPEQVHALCVLGPESRATAQQIAEDVRNSIGADSLTTRMVFTGSWSDKRCSSLEDYVDLIHKAVEYAREPVSRQQSGLLQRYFNLIVKNKELPSHLWIVGEIVGSREEIEHRILRLGHTIRSQREQFGADATVHSYVTVDPSVMSTEEFQDMLTRELPQVQFKN